MNGKEQRSDRFRFRQVDAGGRQLCTVQGKMFVSSLDLSGSSAVFIRRFMNSDLAVHMDNGGYLVEAYTETEAIEAIVTEYGLSAYGHDRFAVEELNWIGYIYRYWVLATGMSSKRVFKIAGSREMRTFYYPYHSLDPEQAIVRIM